MLQHAVYSTTSHGRGCALTNERLPCTLYIGRNDMNLCSGCCLKLLGRCRRLEQELREFDMFLGLATF